MHIKLVTLFFTQVASAERSAAQTRSEVIKLEAEIKTLRSELSGYRERAAMAENEAYTLRKYQVR